MQPARLKPYPNPKPDSQEVSTPKWKNPRTADGVEIFPDTPIWHVEDVKKFESPGSMIGIAEDGVNPFTANYLEYYSTREGALNHGKDHAESICAELKHLAENTPYKEFTPELILKFIKEHL